MSSQENTNDFHDRDKGDAEARTITTEIGTFPSPVPPGPTKYPGSGTPHDPYIVDWDSGDKENPYNWTNPRKWTITAQLAFSTFTVSFCSSSYTGGLSSITRDLHISEEVAILGVSLYVLGFGLGPLVFAPLGEAFGRRPVFLVTYTTFTLFHLGGALCRNVQTLLICRLLAGIFGSSPLTNSSGSVADIWVAKERGVASALYSTAPFMGPVIGPIAGGWIVETRLGWRFNFWLMMMVSACALTIGFLATPETFAPALLRRRARKLQKASGGEIYYVSKYDLQRSKSLLDILKFNLTRPFLFLATEPIVLLLAIYIAIAYAILYSFFAAFPIVFQQHRGFSPGQGGLTFLGVGLGILIGTSLAPINNRLYWRAMERSPTGKAPPEARLYLPIVGGFLFPMGLFWFAWTSQPSIHFIVPVLAGIPTGTGVAFIMQGLVQYIMDTYTIYCASAIASTVLLRSVLAAIFPLISPPMFKKLGDQWAMSLFAFLSVACMPLPILFYKYGPWVRSKSKYARNDGMPISIVPPSSQEKDSEAEKLRAKSSDTAENLV